MNEIKNPIQSVKKWVEIKRSCAEHLKQHLEAGIVNSVDSNTFQECVKKINNDKQSLYEEINNRGETLQGFIKNAEENNREYDVIRFQKEQEKLVMCLSELENFKGRIPYRTSDD